MAELGRYYERWAALTGLCVVVVIFGIQFVLYSRDLDAAAAALELGSGPQATLLYDRDGRLFLLLHDEARTDRRLDQLSPTIVRAVLAAEDRRFWSHRGIDPRRILGAAWVNLKARRIKQGRARSRSSWCGRRRSAASGPGPANGVKSCWP